jgi:hypothetical protein
LKCEICGESFDKTNSFNQHMSYVHHTNQLEDYADQRIISQTFHDDITKYKESNYCKICGEKSEDTICVVLGNLCHYAGSCLKHHDIVLESLRF